jgi:hypothetical protein
MRHLRGVSERAEDDVLLPDEQQGVHLGPVLAAQREEHVEEEAEGEHGGPQERVERREVGGQHERPHEQGARHGQEDEPAGRKRWT